MKSSIFAVAVILASVPAFAQTQEELNELFWEAPQASTDTAPRLFENQDLNFELPYRYRARNIQLDESSSDTEIQLKGLRLGFGFGSDLTDLASRRQKVEETSIDGHKAIIGQNQSLENGVYKAALFIEEAGFDPDTQRRRSFLMTADCRTPQDLAAALRIFRSIRFGPRVVPAPAVTTSTGPNIITVTDRGECWQDDYTFDTRKISAERFGQLLIFGPTQGYKLHADNWLEACQIRDCPSNIHKEAFFENAEANQYQLKKKMEDIRAYKAPAELLPISDYYLEEDNFLFWVNSIRLRFYKSWDPEALAAKYFIKPAKKTIDAGVLCRDLIESLKREKDHDQLYTATQGGLNCVNGEFQHSVSYSKDAWASFLKAYGIEAKHSGEDVCD